MCDGEVSAVRGRTVWSGDRLQVEGHIRHHFFFNSMYLLRRISLHLCLCFFVYLGRDVKTVEVGGDIDFYTLSGVQPDTEYIVTIIPLYEGNTEASPTTARFKIGRRAFSGLPHHQTSPLFSSHQ